MASNENSCKLKLNEFDETFSDDVAENTKVTMIFCRTSFIIKCIILLNYKIKTSANDTYCLCPRVHSLILHVLLNFACSPIKQSELVHIRGVKKGGSCNFRKSYC